jgi:uncharacterized membrane protein (DUF106 family)
MQIVNAILRPIFDGLLMPFKGLHPLVGLTVVSLLTSVMMLVMFKRTSNQDKIAAVKAKITAGLFEIRLFNDDLRAIFRAQGEILRHNLSYLGLSLVPLLWMIVPIVLIIAQLQFHYGYRGLEPGEAALLTVELREDWPERLSGGGVAGKPAVELNAPDAFRIDSPAVWLPSLDEIVWRITPEKYGDWEVGVKLGDEEYSKVVRVSDEIVRRSPSRLAPALLDQVLYPAEPSLPKHSPIRSIAISYPETGSTAGLPTWLWIFFLLSIVFAFALKGRFGVKI